MGQNNMTSYHHLAYRLLAVLFCVLALPAKGYALGSVTITIPASVSFSVTDVSAATVGSPNPFHISFNTLVMLPTNTFRISVQANAANFTSAIGSTIPASNLSWKTSNAVNGTGVNGTLSAGAFNQVYASNTLVLSGSVDLKWTLAAPGSGVKAVSHSLTITWKLEAL
jgi:hypothetical protein